MVNLFATVVPPSSSEEAAAIARAQKSFPGVRVYAIKLCSFTRKGARHIAQPLFNRLVAECPCFQDGGIESVEQDLETALEDEERY